MVRSLFPLVFRTRLFVRLTVLPASMSTTTSHHIPRHAIHRAVRAKMFDPLADLLLVTLDLNAKAILCLHDTPLCDNLVHSLSPPFVGDHAQLGIYLHSRYNALVGRRQVPHTSVIRPGTRSLAVHSPPDCLPRRCRRADRNLPACGPTTSAHIAFMYGTSRGTTQRRWPASRRPPRVTRASSVPSGSHTPFSLRR